MDDSSPNTEFGGKICAAKRSVDSVEGPGQGRTQDAVHHEMFTSNPVYAKRKHL